MATYVNEFAGRDNLRERDIADQMEAVLAGVIRKPLMFNDLVAKLEKGRSHVF